MRNHLYFLLIFFLFSCDEETSIEDNFVVEAFLFQGEPIDDVEVFKAKLYNSSDTTEEVISDAKVKIIYDGDNYELDYDVNSMKYVYNNNDLNIISNKQYGLEVIVNDRTATSQTSVPTKPIGLLLSENKIIIPELVLSRALPTILANLYENARAKISWDNPNNEYHYLTIKYMGDSENPIFSDELPAGVGNFFENFSIVSEPTKDKEYSIIGLSLKNYGRYKVSLFKINQDYVSLFENQEQDSNELNEPPSNIINAFGVFSAFASDTTSFEIVKE